MGDTGRPLSENDAYAKVREGLGGSGNLRLGWKGRSGACRGRFHSLFQELKKSQCSWSTQLLNR
jgi:hypothetical protein